MTPLSGNQRLIGCVGALGRFWWAVITIVDPEVVPTGLLDLLFNVK